MEWNPQADSLLRNVVTCIRYEYIIKQSIGKEILKKKKKRTRRPS